MGIDEAGNDQPPGGVDDRIGRAVVFRADMGDFVVLENQDTGFESVVPAAVPAMTVPFSISVRMLSP